MFRCVLLLLCVAACANAAGSLYQHWTRPFLEAEVDNTETLTESGTTEHAVTISLQTMDYRVCGFRFQATIKLEDGTIRTIFRANVPLPDKAGEAIVITEKLGEKRPVKVILFYVQRLVTEAAEPLVYPF